MPAVAAKLLYDLPVTRGQVLAKILSLYLLSISWTLTAFIFGCCPLRVKETVMFSPVRLVTQLLDENATIVNGKLCIVANGVDPGCSVFPNRNLSMGPN